MDIFSPELVLPGLIVLAGLWSILYANREAKAVERRMEEGDDRYFEEQRFYRAYRSSRDPKWIRRKGAVVVILGLAVAVLHILKPT